MKGTTEYYSMLKRKVILTHPTTWKNLKYITLSEISPLQMGMQAGSVMSIIYQTAKRKDFFLRTIGKVAPKSAEKVLGFWKNAELYEYGSVFCYLQNYHAPYVSFFAVALRMRFICPSKSI